MLSNSGWRDVFPAKDAANFKLRHVTSGRNVSLADLSYDHRLILTFLPGVWAPWSRKLLAEMDDNLPRFESAGLDLLVIAAQYPEQLATYSQKHRLKLPVLADELASISKRYGVYDANQSEPMRLSKPAIYILNEDKKIIRTFIGRHLSDRPSAEDIIRHSVQPLTRNTTKHLFMFRFPHYAQSEI